MLNPLADVATAGETILAVWVWGPSTIGNALSNVLGNVGAPTDPATAITAVESAVQGATGLDGIEPAQAFQGGSAVYIGMSLVVNSDGDGQPFNTLFGPVASLGGVFTPGSGAILAFVDYGNAGESSAPLAQQAAKADDTGNFHGGLVPTAAITGIQDAIDSLGPETPYFQGYFGVGPGGQLINGAGSLVPAGTGTGSGGFASEISTQTTANNSVIGPAAGAGQKAAQALTGITGVIALVLVGLIGLEVYKTTQGR